MLEAAAELEFEEAARLRDEIRRLENADLGIGAPRRRRAKGRREEKSDSRSHRQGPRSTAGQPGTRQYRGKSKRAMRL